MLKAVGQLKGLDRESPPFFGLWVINPLLRIYFILICRSRKRFSLLGLHWAEWKTQKQTYLLWRVLFSSTSHQWFPRIRSSFEHVSFAVSFGLFPKAPGLVSAVKVTQRVLNDNSPYCTDWRGRDPDSPDLHPNNGRELTTPQGTPRAFLCSAAGSSVGSAYRDIQY